MDPYPLAKTVVRRAGKLINDALLNERSVPPGTYGKQHVTQYEAFAVADDAELPRVANPARYFLAYGAPFVEVVISRAQHDAGQPAQDRKILLHDNNLSAEIDDGTDIEGIACEDDQVELWRCADQPVELRQ